MTMNVEGLLDNYYAWLKDKTAWKQLKDWVEITTPYLDRHNDYLQIYLKNEDGNYVLTDDGYIIDDLEISGCSLDNPKRQKMLNVTLNGFGVKKENNKLLVKTNKDHFAIDKHNLIQAMLSVNDMFYLARSNVLNLFFEDVQLWLDNCDIRAIPRSSFMGKSGYVQHFDFSIPKSRKAPERFIQTINNPNKEKAKDLAFGWLDTKENRADESRLYALANDNEKEVPNTIIKALESYGIITIKWSERHNFVEELAA
jgi:hypothetical protein